MTVHAGPDDEAELARKAEVLGSIVRWMFGAAILGAGVGFADQSNDVRVTALFFAPVFATLLGLRWLLSRGRVMGASVGLSLWLWLLVAFVTLFFDGLKGGNATLFGVTVMLAGSLVSGRAAVRVAVLSSAWCAMVGVLELTGSLPPQLGPYTPMNAWSALTISLIIMAVLVRNSLASLQRMHQRASQAAKERDEALRRSIHSQKMELVGTLASGVAHDFNNLLAVIIASKDGLKARLPAQTDRAERELLEDLETAADRATLLTRQMLSYGRGQSVALEDVDLARAVAAFIPLARRVCGELIEVRAEVVSGPVMTRASPAGLEQVLLNLVTNARDAMPGGGRLDAQLSVDGAVAVLRILDTGKGMDEATRARIFDPFFSTKSAGMGLGLATVHNLVTQFGGTVQCTSTPGAGTTFEVRLPVVAATAGPVDLPAPQPPATGKETILLVDDDALVRRAVTRTLEIAGFEVVTAVDGSDALAQLAGRPTVACVVSDIVMPGMDGIALAERLKEVRPELPLVLISGNQQPPASVLGPRRRFLAKPVSGDALVRAITEARRERRGELDEWR